jgi:hypothetical protein
MRQFEFPVRLEPIAQSRSKACAASPANRWSSTPSWRPAACSSMPAAADRRDREHPEPRHAGLGCQPGGYLVNVARGGHLVEADLLALLDSGPARRRDPRRAARRSRRRRAPVLAPPEDHADAAHLGAHRARGQRSPRSPARSARWRRGEPVAGVVDRVQGILTPAKEPHHATAFPGEARRCRPARRPAERERPSARRRQDRPRAPPAGRGAGRDRSHQLRLAQVGAADGRRRRGHGGHPAQARRSVLGAHAQHEGL